MKRALAFFLITIFLTSCFQSVEIQDKKRLFPFEGGNGYFPKPVLAFAALPSGDLPLFMKYFPDEYFTKALRMLDEGPMASSYGGTDVIRLTYTAALGDAYFTVRIEKSGNDVSIVHKVSHYLWTTTHIDSVDTDSLTSYSYDRLEFDSTRNEYQMVSYTSYLHLDSEPYRNSLLVTGRKSINPILKKEVINLELDQWNHLIDLLNDKSYLIMDPVDTAARIDGHDYLLELQTQNGYYVVDRFVPDQGPYLDIVSSILKLVGREPER